MDLASEWREAKAEVPMADGKSYVVQFKGDAGVVILAVDVEGDGPPTDAEAVDALVYFNRMRDGDGEREFAARAGWTWWLKAEGGASRLSASEI